MSLRMLVTILVLVLLLAPFYLQLDLELKPFAITNPVFHPDPSVHYWQPPFEVSYVDHNYTDEEIRTDPQIKRLTATANQLLKGIEAISSELNLPTPKPDSFVPTRANTLGGQRIQLDSKIQPFSFHFCKTNDEFWCYFNVAALQEAGKNESAKSHWTSEKAIQIGAAFLPVFAHTSNIALDSPQAVFKPSTMEDADAWQISWQRVDGKGHIIGSDRAILDISETAGLIGANVELNDPYVAEQGEPRVSESKAVAIAEASSQGYAVADSAPGTNLKNYELLIVEPGGLRGVPARLAWVIWLRHPHSGMYVPSDWSTCEVDAYTGEILGGDTFL